jgi:hypothetical protein
MLLSQTEASLAVSYIASRAPVRPKRPGLLLKANRPLWLTGRITPSPSSIEAAAMAFKLVHAKYDRESERAYVELRDEDDDGGEILAVTIFSFRTTARLSKQQIEQDIVRKARHILKRAAAST